jgi:hypothetical protein
MKTITFHCGCVGCLLLGAAMGAGVAEATGVATPSAADLALRDPFVSPIAKPKPPPTPDSTPSTLPTPTPTPPPVAPPDSGTPPPEDHTAIVKAALKVQGFVKQGDRQYAMVGNRLVTVGDIVQVRVGAATYRFRVSEIKTTAVKFDPLQ